jgi:hypothetical protein
MASLYRITNLGGQLSRGASGSGGSEFYAVEGLNPYDMQGAINIGLPNIGEFHPSANAAYLGTVQAVQRVLEFPPNLVIYRIIYNTGGTFNFSIRLGARSQRIVEWLAVPTLSGPGGVGPFISLEPSRIPRYGFRRSETTRYVGNLDTINNVVSQNQGRLYFRDSNRWEPVTDPQTPDVLHYQLAGVSIVTDASNQSRVETIFERRHAVKGFAPHEYPNVGDVTVPPLPSNGDYVIDVANGIIDVTSPLITYETGGDLFWQ